MPDYDELHDKVQDMETMEQRLRDALEAGAEIRYDGIAAIRCEIDEIIAELKECRRKVELAMESAKKMEELANNYGVPVWRDQ